MNALTPFHSKEKLMDMKHPFEGLEKGPTPQQQAFLERMAGEKQAQSDLRRELHEFIEQEANMVKGLASQGKKNLAREIVHLRGVLKTPKAAVSRIQPGAPTFAHVEAFKLMTYREQDAVGEPETLLVWNSRDGVTPFVVIIGERRYQHDIPLQQGPFYDRPPQATHEWVSRTDWQVLEAWSRTLAKAVQMGKLDPDRAAALRNDLATAESCHYRIGLRNMATGAFTDQEELQTSVADPA